jgi:hypothetical protein
MTYGSLWTILQSPQATSAIKMNYSSGLQRFPLEYPTIE